jgi:hypothetical protein
MKPNLVTAFLSAVILMPAFASAVSLGEYTKASNNPAKQSQMFKPAYETAVARTLVALRDTHFKDGKEKTARRIERDRERASRIESMVGRLTTEQAAALVNMIAEYAQAQLNTELEDVISSFLLTEADKLAQSSTNTRK